MHLRRNGRNVTREEGQEEEEKSSSRGVPMRMCAFARRARRARFIAQSTRSTRNK